MKKIIATILSMMLTFPVMSETYQVEIQITPIIEYEVFRGPTTSCSDDSNSYITVSQSGTGFYAEYRVRWYWEAMPLVVRSLYIRNASLLSDEYAGISNVYSKGEMTSTPVADPNIGRFQICQNQINQPPAQDENGCVFASGYYARYSGSGGNTHKSYWYWDGFMIRQSPAGGSFSSWSSLSRAYTTSLHNYAWGASQGNRSYEICRTPR
jgi:hypothetical protein